MSYLITGSSLDQRLKKAKQISPNALEFDISKIDEVRQIRELISEGFSVIITQAQDLTIEAQNALLKVLEEPPEKVIIILLAEKESQLLPTVLSRCVISHLSDLSHLGDLESTPQELEILTWIQENNQENGFAWVEKSRLDRSEAIILLKKLQVSGHANLLKNGQNSKLLQRLMTAQKYLEANTNVRLTLENLFLN